MTDTYLTKRLRLMAIDGSLLAAALLRDMLGDAARKDRARAPARKLVRSLELGVVA